MNDSIPIVLDARALPEPVLRAAVLDGELYPVGDGYRVVDLPLDPDSRAGSLASIAVGGRVIADRTAAWVWGALPRAPLPRSTILASSVGVGHPSGVPEPGVRVRSARLRAGDVARPGGVPVTSARRTAIDLACADPRDWVEDAVLAELIAFSRASIDELSADLATRARLRGRARGLARLQVLVTR